MTHLGIILGLLLSATCRPHHVACPPGWSQPYGPKWSVLVCAAPSPECWTHRRGWEDCSGEPVEIAVRSYAR